MLCGNISYEFLNKYCFTYSGTTEKTDFSTFCIWCQKVDYLNSCLQDFNNRALFLKRRWLSVDYPVFLTIKILSTINCIAKYIKQSA